MNCGQDGFEHGFLLDRWWGPRGFIVSRLSCLGGGKDEGLVVVALFTDSVNSLSPDSRLIKVSLFLSGQVPALFWPFSCSSGLSFASSCLGSCTDLCPDLFPLSCDRSPFSDVTLFWVFLRTLASLIRVSNSIVPYQKPLMHLPFVLEEGSLTSLLNSIASQHFSIICDRISCIKHLSVQHQLLPHVCWSNLCLGKNAHP